MADLETVANLVDTLASENAALRDALTFAVAFMSLYAEQVDNPDPEILESIDRAKEALQPESRPFTGLCAPCGRRIAILCEDCFDEVRIRAQALIDGERASGMKWADEDSAGDTKEITP